MLTPTMSAARPVWAEEALDELIESAAKRAALEAFEEAIREGVNRVLPIEASVGQWPVSGFLGEVGSDLSAILFKACHLAVSRKDADAAEVLREFQQAVADQYAADNFKVWQ